MHRRVLAAVMFGGGILLGLGASEMIHAQVTGLVTRQIFKTDLANLPGQEVLVYASEWPPGFRLPLHKHEGGHELTYVIEGEQTFEIEGVGTRLVKAGEIIYTPPDTPHFGRNATGAISRTLVIRIKDKDKPVMTEVKS
ncbi:MAG TPA: cupin domain-containing protein [Bradyrhizobium sp.]|uniref:cupin domain-containing protein n=1 Tax=Bradyrhizobium sp. TaxID=376 RepID=UPI002D7FA290|nr:cupin domain-containing protein [Bradyrhizobium sp.]HET7888481.1 cupin domain-containing protein [Bradyrhizobium sp.]